MKRGLQTVFNGLTPLYAAVIAAGVGLTGCDDQSDKVAAHAYSGVGKCIEGGVYTAEECRSFAAVTVKTDRRSAPRYAQDADCIRDFKECHATSQPDGALAYSPFTRGFYVGALSNTDNISAVPYYTRANGQSIAVSGAQISKDAFEAKGAVEPLTDFAETAEPAVIEPGAAIVAVEPAAMEAVPAEAAPAEAAPGVW